MTEVAILREIRDICLYISFPTNNPNINISMIREMYSISCIGPNGIIPGITNHYNGLLKELTTYCDNYYGNIRTTDSGKCINRMKYRMKAIVKGRELQKEKIAMDNLFASMNSYKIDDCPCCYEEITNNNLAVLVCDHLLCISCVAQIKGRNSECPMCRETLNVTICK